MDPAELLDQFVDLARAAGFEVREIRGAAAEETGRAAMSGSCRLKGRIWVLLSGADSADLRIDVLSQALAAHAAEFLETRYLSPAVRARLGADFGPA